MEHGQAVTSLGRACAQPARPSATSRRHEHAEAGDELKEALLDPNICEHGDRRRVDEDHGECLELPGHGLEVVAERLAEVGVARASEAMQEEEEGRAAEGLVGEAEHKLVLVEEAACEEGEEGGERLGRAAAAEWREHAPLERVRHLKIPFLAPEDTR